MALSNTLGFGACHLEIKKPSFVQEGADHDSLRPESFRS